MTRVKKKVRRSNFTTGTATSFIRVKRQTIYHSLFKVLRKFTFLALLIPFAREVPVSVAIMAHKSCWDFLVHLGVVGSGGSFGWAASVLPPMLS